MSVCTCDKVEISLFCIMGCLQACDVFLILTLDWSWRDSFLPPLRKWRLQKWNQWPNSSHYSHDYCCNGVEMGTSHVNPLLYLWARITTKASIHFLSALIFFLISKRQCCEGFKESHMTAMGVEGREVEDPSVWPNGWDTIPPALPKDKQPLSCNFSAQIMTPLVQSPSSPFPFSTFTLIPGNVSTSCVVSGSSNSISSFSIRVENREKERRERDRQRLHFNFQDTDYIFSLFT